MTAKIKAAHKFCRNSEEGRNGGCKAFGGRLHGWRLNKREKRDCQWLMSEMLFIFVLFCWCFNLLQGQCQCKIFISLPFFGILPWSLINSPNLISSPNFYFQNWTRYCHLFPSTPFWGGISSYLEGNNIQQHEDR